MFHSQGLWGCWGCLLSKCHWMLWNPIFCSREFSTRWNFKQITYIFSHLNNFKNSFKKYGYRCLLSDKSFSALLVILTGPSYHLLPLKFFWKFYRENSMVLKNMIAQLHIYLIAFNCCHALCKNLIQSSKHYLILGLHLTFKNLMSSKHQKFMVETET